MNGLPVLVADEILFRMDLKTLAKMRCTGKAIRSHISYNPEFKSEYFSRAGSSLLHIASNGSPLICYQPSLGSSSTVHLELKHQVLDYCSGLLLFFRNGLYVVNPYTGKFGFIDHSMSKLFPWVGDIVYVDRRMNIGFAVDQIDQTAERRFKIVCIKDRQVGDPYETMYEFEINTGSPDVWRLSKTTITCSSSNLKEHTKPIYVNGSLHWLRDDGSIVAFDPETEKVRLIPINFPQDLSSKTLFTAADNQLTLISATDEEIYVYALENILTDPKWVIARRIKNVVMDEESLLYWDIVAYDDKCLLLREKKDGDCLVHQYDLKANKWGLMGSIPRWCDANQDFYQFTPSFSSVIGLDEKLQPWHGKRISFLSGIMGLILGVSPKKIETQLYASIEDTMNPIFQGDDNIISEVLRSIKRRIV